MRRSQDDFAVICRYASKHYKVKIDEANLYIRKMTVSENVASAIEKILLQALAVYRYNEVIIKKFLAITGQQSAGNLRILLPRSQSEETLLHYSLV